MSDILEVVEAASSQDLARAELQDFKLSATSADLSERVWVRLQRQNAGRGRQGRGWISFEGDLLVSCGVEVGPEFTGRRNFFPLVAGESLYAALRALDVLPKHSFLKWPNDLVADSGKGLVKYAGILVEAFGERKFVAGWGVNLAAEERTLPPETGYRAGSLGGVDAATVFAALRQSFAIELKAWASAPLAYERDLVSRLEMVAMKPLWGREGLLTQQNRVAIARGLEPDGSLRVSPKENARAHLAVSSGEFRVR